MCIGLSLPHSQPLMMNNASQPRATRFKQNNNKKTLPNQTWPQEQALQEAVELHVSPGFRGRKTKPPVNEETEKTPEPSPALSKKAFLTVLLLSGWRQPMVSLGQGQGHAAPLPTVGLEVSGGPLGHSALGSLPVGWGGGPAQPCQAEVLGVWVMLQQRGARKRPAKCVPASEKAMRARGAHTPTGRSLVIVADGSSGAGRCVRLIRALGPWVCSVCGHRGHFQGPAGVAGSRAGPSLVALGAGDGPPGMPCRCARQPRAAWALACVASSLRQLLPAVGQVLHSSQVGWHCAGVPVPMGAISRSAWCSHPSWASAELSVSARPAPPALPPQGCVCRGWRTPGLGCVRWGAAVGRRQEGAGQPCGSPSLSLGSLQELQPVVWRGQPWLLLHAGPHPPCQVSSVGWEHGASQGSQPLLEPPGANQECVLGRGQVLHPTAPPAEGSSSVALSLQ